MNSTVFFCFTCARDAELLPLHAAAIRRLVVSRPSIVYVLPEDEAPQVKVPAGTLKITSNWARGDRLSGVPAIRGILATMATLGRSLGGESAVCVKLDSDTVLCSLDWLARLYSGSSYVGFESWHPMLPTGACYGITADTAAACLEASDPWPWLDVTERLPEDRTIFMLACQTGGVAEVLPFASSEHMLAFSPYYYTDPSPVDPTRGIVAVHCAERPQMERLVRAGCERTVQVSRAMRCCLRQLKHLDRNRCHPSCGGHCLQTPRRR